MLVGSLFAGIGGFDLGFERAGFEIAWQVEIDEYCRRVLAKHFPNAERFGDIRECGSHNLRSVDVIVGGFPCQDISSAGRRAGISGERSGLWEEMRRIICTIRPSFAVIENVAALFDRGIERVLLDLAEGGYDAEWEIISACSFGAPHPRERVFIIAYPSRGYARQHEKQPENKEWESHSPPVRRRFRDEPQRCDWWEAEPKISRVDDGVSDDMVRGYGNAVVPQIAQWIAERIKRQLTLPTDGVKGKEKG